MVDRPTTLDSTAPADGAAATDAVPDEAGPIEKAAASFARASLDQCVKCTICETQCPVAAVTPLFPGPKYVGPQAERFREGLSVDYSLDYCSGCSICTTVCPQGVKIAEINARARAVMKRDRMPLRDRLITARSWRAGS